MRVVLVLSLVVAAACAPSGPPTREPDIVGLITIMSDDGHTILVEERPQETSGSAKARILVTEQTRIWRLGSPITTATWSDLRVGTGVRAWFDGAVETSYPLGAKGAAIAIDPSAAAPSLYVLSKGAPAVIVTVNGFDAAHVECNGGAAIRPGADLTLGGRRHAEVERPRPSERARCRSPALAPRHTDGRGHLKRPGPRPLRPLPLGGTRTIDR